MNAEGDQFVGVRDIDAIEKEHGDPDWVHNIYVRLHPFALVEFAVFALALVALYFGHI